MEVKPILTRQVSQAQFYLGSSPLPAPGEANAVPRPLDGCCAAGRNASDTKLLTLTGTAHAARPRNKRAETEKPL